MNYLQVLRRLGPSLERKLDEGLARLTQAVKETTSEGEIVLRLKVKMREVEDGYQTVQVIPEIKVKAPTPQASGMTMFMREDFGLDTRHPDQPDTVTKVDIQLAAREASASAAAASA